MHMMVGVAHPTKTGHIVTRQSSLTTANLYAPEKSFLRYHNISGGYPIPLRIS